MSEMVIPAVAGHKPASAVRMTWEMRFPRSLFPSTVTWARALAAWSKSRRRSAPARAALAAPAPSALGAASAYAL